MDYKSAFEDCARRHIPLVAHYGHKDCGACSMVRVAFLTDIFKNWMAEKDYVFVDGSGDVYAHNELRLPNGWTPYFRVYWNKGNGTVVDLRFAGRCGEVYGGIPGTTKEQDLRKDNLAKALIKAIDDAIGDYVPVVYAPSVFETDDAHPYEVEAGLTTSLTVGFDRPAALSVGVSTNVVVIGSETNTIVWADGETHRELPFTDLASYKVGDRVVLSSYDPARPEDGIQSTSAIVFVEPQANSVRNPRGPGEDFAFGEWTIDYAAARAKVNETPGAKLLVLFAGILWCPDCHGLERTLLSDPAFPAWAETNKVALVLMDQGRGSTPATAAGCRAPRLVTYELDPRETGVSGASYASRHMILPKTAETIMSTVTRLTKACLAPESLAVRCGNPTVVLLDPKTEQPIARLNALADAKQNYDPKENLARLDELIGLTTPNEPNAYPSTTTLSLATSGTVGKVDLQINDSARIYRLTGLEPKTHLAFTAKVSPSRVVTLSLLRTDSTLAAAEVLATGQNAVEYSFGKKTGTVYLRVSAYDEEKAYGGKTALTLSLAGEVTPIESPNDAVIYTGLAVERVVALDSEEPLSSLRYKVLSGKLPSGLRLAYDSKTRQLILKGTVKAPAETTVLLSVSGRAPDGSTVTEEVELELTVLSSTAINPFVGKAQAQIVPLFSGDRLMGVLDIKATTANKLTARFTGTGKKVLSFSGAWQTLDDEGAAVADLALRTGETLQLGLAKDGQWSAVLNGTADGELVQEGARGLTSAELARYAGSYTVTLPAKGHGVGYLTMTIKNTTKVSVSGILGDGTTVRATTMPVADGPDHAVLPVFVRTSKDVLSVPLKLAADGQKLQKVEPMTVTDLTGGATWSHLVAGQAFTVPLEVYGAWYDPAMNLETYCRDAYEIEDAAVVMTASLVADASVGAMGRPAVSGDLAVRVDPAALTVIDAKNWLKLKLAKKTGIVTGTAVLQFPDVGKKATAKVKGVLLPGWYDCGCGDGVIDRPFLSASVTYKDKIGGKSNTLACHLEVNAPTQLK